MARSRRYVKRKYQKKYTKRFRRQIHTDAIIFGALGVGALGGSIFFGNSFLSDDLVAGMSIVLAVVLVLVIGSVMIVRKMRKKKQRAFYMQQRTLADLRAMDPFEFEKYIGFVFERLGYAVRVTQGQGDHGIDVALKKEGKTTAIQVKRYAQHNTIGEPALREFYGSYADEFDRGAYVTTSGFTPPARAWAKERNMILIDAQMLMKTIEKSQHA